MATSAHDDLAELLSDIPNISDAALTSSKDVQVNSTQMDQTESTETFQPKPFTPEPEGFETHEVHHPDSIPAEDVLELLDPHQGSVTGYSSASYQEREVDGELVYFARACEKGLGVIEDNMSLEDHNIDWAIFSKTVLDGKIFHPVTNEPVTSSMESSSIVFQRELLQATLSLTTSHDPGDRKHQSHTRHPAAKFNSDEADPHTTTGGYNPCRAILSFGFQSLRNMRAYSLVPGDMNVLPNVLKQEVAVFSPQMKATVEEYSRRERKPILLEIKFDLEHTADENVFLGKGEWRKRFADTARLGMIRMIVCGNSNSLQQLKVAALIFAYERSHNPYKRFWTTLPSGRKVFNKEAARVFVSDWKASN